MREALSAFGFVGRHMPILMLILAPWLLVSIGLAVWPDFFPSAFDAMAAVWLPLIQPFVIPGPFSTLQQLIPLWVPQVVAFCGFAVAWQRQFLMQGRPKRGFVPAWLLFTGMVLVYLGLLLVFVSLIGMLVESMIPPESQQRFGVAILALAVAAGLIGGARLSPVLAAAALGDREMTLGRAWNATRRRSGDLGIGLLLTFLPSVVILMGLSGAAQVIGPYAAVAVRMVVWTLGIALAATFVALAYLRISGRRGT